MGLYKLSRKVVVIRVPVWAIALLAALVVAAGYYALTRGGGPVRLADTSISTATVGDGGRITLGYRIRSDAVRPAVLAASLIDAEGRSLVAPGSDAAVTLKQGTAWYYQTVVVNAPPGQPGGVGRCDAVWSIAWDPNGSATSRRRGALTVERPVAVRVPILLYHKVDDEAHSPYYVTTEQFRAQMAALAAYGYTPITLEDLMEMRGGRKPIPARPVMITLDDAYRDWLTRADPVLAEHPGFVAVGFVPTLLGEPPEGPGAPGVRPGARPASAPAAIEPIEPLLTWDDMRAMHRSGRWDFQAHSRSHGHLDQLEDADLAVELRLSRRELSRQLGKEVAFLAYPYGDYDARVAQAAWQAGYRAAAATGDGIEQDCADKFALRRVYVYSHDSVNCAGGAERFFMRKVDPDFPAPDIAMEALECVDAAGGEPLDPGGVAAGTTVKVRLKAHNLGSAVRAVVSLNLVTAGEIAYDSHQVSPPQDGQVDFPSGATRTVEWTWTIPGEAPGGQYTADVGFHDEHYVLGWAYFLKMPAFVVAGRPPSTP